MNLKIYYQPDPDRPGTRNAYPYAAQPFCWSDICGIRMKKVLPDAVNASGSV